jgi:hypothetical protein
VSSLGETTAERAAAAAAALAVGVSLATSSAARLSPGRGRLPPTRSRAAAS